MMAAVIDGAESAFEQKVILHNVSWQTYERLLHEQPANRNTRLNYDQGMLEIMILSLKHERLKHMIATLVELLAGELAIDIEGAGSTTFRREDLLRGFEPDACFYIQNAEHIRSKEHIDLTVDPPPDLVIEIDISHVSLDKLPIFASLGVAEVWRYDGQQITLLSLQNGYFSAQSKSFVLPGVSVEALAELIAVGQTLKRGAWLQRVREWAACNPKST
jgi:Uma2 family endonuclease